MASYPFGLREDPFVAGFELSLEETRQLIQNRVSAYGGDGAVLFPSETCAEIHRRAHGVASAALKLAEHAMLRAAREGATAVSPAHAMPGGAESSAQTRNAPAPPTAIETPPATVASAAAPLPTPATVASAPAPSTAKPAPSATGSPTPAPARLDMTALRSSLQAAVAAQPSPDATPTGPGAKRPPMFRPDVAPSRPLTPVSGSPPPVVLPPFSPGITPLTPPGESVDERTPWPASVGVFVLFIVGTVLLVLILHPGGPAMRSLARTATPASMVADSVPRLADDSSLVVYRAPVPAVPLPTPARVETVRTETPKFGLEVARFLVPERAKEEHRRLAANGHKSRVLKGWESGGAIYRVVVGPFTTRGEAERAADQLLVKGLINQARVVSVKPPASAARSTRTAATP